MLKRANTPAKVKTTVRARVAARPATMVAKAKTLAKAREAAQLTEAKCLKHSDETAVMCQTGRSFQTPTLVFGTEERPFTFLEGFNRYGVLIYEGGERTREKINRK
jgi:hypothetical protein